MEQGVTDVFGYPGGMVTHLMESFRKREDYIKAHVNYHEQAAAFVLAVTHRSLKRPALLMLPVGREQPI